MIIHPYLNEGQELIQNRYNKYPGFVKLILIRKVTDIAALGIAEKNEPKRFEKAFSGVPKNVWHVFEKPEECYKLIQDVTAKR